MSRICPGIKFGISSDVDTTSTTPVMDLLDGPIHTVSAYNPVPDMFISFKYQDIIPPDPIFDSNEVFIVPGSREWFTYMYKLDISTRDERIKAKAEAEHVQQQAEAELSCLRQQLAVDSKRQADALYYGTTYKHFNHRRHTVDTLTDWSESHFCTMSRYRDKDNPKLSKRNTDRTLKLEMNDFIKAYPDCHIPSLKRRENTRTFFVNNDVEKIPLDPYTSDDTKMIETCPLKRDVNNAKSLSDWFDTPKRTRFDPSSASDSKQAGSSSSSIITN
ncbi:hypothetical protein RhiirA4_474038 [Rhizophagus irregularis]|uniref:Uncharacterized protein n=1 Tax=Rhizophagus irregularis TaxID=588596 RepID=A0A2I1H7S3_9GLOM|nr:hypothetical protein RhiirA4_474038 [Rhizophagus irregularis]